MSLRGRRASVQSRRYPTDHCVDGTWPPTKLGRGVGGQVDHLGGRLGGTLGSIFDRFVTEPLAIPGKFLKGPGPVVDAEAMTVSLGLRIEHRHIFRILRLRRSGPGAGLPRSRAERNPGERSQGQT